MKLLEIYSSLLQFAGLEDDKDGFINTNLSGKREPVLVDGLRLVLPTPEQLKSFKTDEKIIFHLLAENTLRPESEVFKRFHNIVNIRLNYTTGVIAQSLLLLLASPEHHKNLTPEQQELLLVHGDVDGKTVPNFIASMVAGMKQKADKLFTNIYIKKGGTKGKEKFMRLGVVTFNYYHELADTKLRVKDKECFKRLMEFMFLDIAKADAYNMGSSSRVAPNLDALLMTAVNIASRLNDLLEIYRDYIEGAEQMMFNSDWVEYLQNMDALTPEIRKIPMHTTEHGIVEEPVAQLQAAPAPVFQQPYQAPIPGVYPPQPLPHPGPAKPKGGSDFETILQNNPALIHSLNLATGYGAQHMPMTYPGQSARPEPSWAFQQQQPYPYPPQQQYYQPQQPYPAQQPYQAQQYYQPQQPYPPRY